VKQWLGILEGRGFAQSPYELTLVGALLLAVLWPAASLSAAGLIVIAHAAFLLTLYIVCRTATGQLHRTLGLVFFAGTVALLGGELLVAHTTGLHLNLFVLSLLFEAGAADNIGLPAALLALPALVILGLILLSRRHLRHRWGFKKRALILLCLASLALTQALYGYLYFTGVPDVMETRRKLPFFAALHPYRVEKLLEPVLGERPPNPFALSTTAPGQVGAAAPAEEALSRRPVTPGKSVLLVIVDSLRAKDIRDEPALAPSLAAWSRRGDYRLDHISTANCTHFSFFSLFTGRLPTAFSSARQNRDVPHGILPRLAAGGYRISTAEALSLDWYDLAGMLALSGRHVAESGSARDRDSFVTQTTIDILGKNTDMPFFHLAYYNGLHFPYGDAAPLPGLKGGTAAGYRQAISAADADVGTLLAALSGAGVLEDTLVIVTSDHGEELLEGGRLGHASALSDEQTRVPLLILGADSDTSRIESHRDIVPFLLQELGAAARPYPRPTIAANCSVDFPKGFAVFDAAAPGGRTDFAYEDGFLSPVPPPASVAGTTGTDRKAARESAKEAAISLIDAIAESDAEPGT
jgi:membrane-anchored protein YejM (alkaline phosphatase superfamily)